MSKSHIGATLIERFAGIIKVPYIISCLIVSILIGPPGAIALAYVTTGLDIEKAISMTITFIAGVGTTYWMGIAILSLEWFLLFYIFYMLRFMRQRLISAEEKLLPVLPEGKQTFQKAFGLVSKHWPPIVIAAAIIAFYFISSGDYLLASFTAYTVNIINTIFLVIAFPIWFIICTTFAWVYFGSIYGIYKLGQKHLMLKSSSEDRMLGVKPFGDLSLSLSVVYFSAMIILILNSIAGAIGTPIIGMFVFFTLVAIFVTVGIILFFVPLFAIHKRMIEQKENERSRLRNQAYKGVEEKVLSGPQDTVEEMKKKLESLHSIVSLEMAEKSLNSVPDWPIDMPIISKFVTIILSVIAILVAQLILQLLKF